MKLKSALAAAAILVATPLLAQTPAAKSPAPAVNSPAPAQTPAASPTPSQTPASSAPGASSAAAAPAAPPVDPAKAAAVRQLLAATDSGKLGEEFIDLMITRVQQAAQKVIPQADRQQAFMDAFKKNYATRLTADQIDNAVIPIYAEHLSLKDIQAMVAFYTSPEGKDVMKVLPDIIQESNNMGASMAQPAAVDVLRQMTTDYPEIEQVLPKQGAAAPQGSGAGQAPAQTPPPSLRQIPSNPQ